MTDRELWEALRGAGTMDGNSFLGQWNNAQARIDKLNSLYGGDITDENARNALSTLRASKASAAIGGGLAAMQGLTGILGDAGTLAGIGDTQGIENNIGDVRAIGSSGIGDWSQLSQAYSDLGNADTDVSYSDVRGASRGERVGQIGSSALSGAAAGAQIDPILGTAFGGAAGFVGGLVGNMMGNSYTRAKERSLNMEGQLAQDAAMENLGGAQERLADSGWRSSVQRRAAVGGFIRRRLGGAHATEGPSGRITGTRCKGGLMVRIKR